MKTCVIIDDHALFAHSLALLLNSSYPDTQVVSFPSCLEACNWMREHTCPDLVLLDIHLRHESGLRFLRDIEHFDFPPPVLIISSDSDARKISACIELGASGFISKSETPEQLLQAVSCILSQGMYFNEQIQECTEDVRTRERDKLSQPSEQQNKILWYLQQGLENKEIANRLNLSEHTIKYHLSKLYKKLGVKNRTECLDQAGKQGLVREDRGLP